MDSRLVTGVDFVTVPTEDYEVAAEFYGTVLGLPFGKRWGQMPAGEFETGNLTIAVMQSDAFGVEFEPHSHPIALQVDDVEAARAELESRGSGCGSPAVGGGPRPARARRPRGRGRRRAGGRRRG